MTAKRNRLSVCCIVFTFLLAAWILFPGSDAGAAPKGKATYLVPTAFEMTGGDPHTTTGASGSSIIADIHNGLISKEVDGRYHQGIAKSWKVAANWEYMTFKLDGSAMFHDGTPVIAEDVKFSLDRVPTLKGYFAPVFKKYIERVEVVDPETVKVYFKKPYIGFYTALARYIGIIPKHYVEKVGDVEFAAKPIGAGPFKVLELKQDVHVKMEAVNNHFRKTPNVKYLNELHVAESATRFAMLKAGEADVSWADPPTYQSILKDPTMTIIMSKYTYLRTLNFHDLAFPDEKSPFHDIRVRMAAAYAIDYAGITKYVMHGTSEPYGDILPPYATGYDPSIQPHEYNPEKAKALLKEAGYPNGFDTVIYSDMPVKDSTEAIAASLKKVGIRAKVNIPEHLQWTKMIREKKLKGLGSHPGPWWSGYSHPGLALASNLGKTSDWVYYSPPEIAEWVDSLLLKTDEQELKVIAREISKKYREQYVRANLWAIHIPYVIGPKVKYWQNVPGHIFSSQYEFLELK
jgi:peptide/nickel transport system substrate-binding protein